MYCSKCGKKIDDSSKFCEYCGAAVEIPTKQATQKTQPTPTKVVKAETKQTVKTEKPQKKGFFAQLLAEVLDLLKHPKKLIPTFVLSAIWLILPMVMGFIPGANLPVVRFFATLTYANGGVFGGFFGNVGGIFGKAVFAAVVNGFVLSLCAKKNPFKGIKKGIAGVFAGGLKAISPLLIGGGAGLVLYWFFNITSAPQNSAVAVVAAVAAIQAIGKQNGLLFGAVFYLMKKISKGKSLSKIAVSRILTGLTGGFTIGFALTFIRYAFVIILLGLVMLGVGIAIQFIGKNGAKRVAVTMALVLMLGGTVLPFATMTVFAESNLPKGYVDTTTENGFKVGTSNSAVSNYDGFYLELKSVTSSWMTNKVDYATSKLSSEVGLTDIQFDNMTYTLVKNGNNPDFTLTGYCKFSKNGRETELSHFGQYTYSFDYTFNINVSFDSWSYNNAIFKIDGTEQASWSSDEPGFQGGNEINPILGLIDMDNCHWKTDPDDKSVRYLIISSNGNKSGIYLKFHILGLLPTNSNTPATVGSTDTSDDKPEYVPYRGRLTYNNGKTNKHGQPFPDLMDFDGDGELTWSDEIIRTTLSHNPDYLDTPEGAALVLVAVISALFGSGLGVGISTIASTGSSALGGLNINLEFADDEEETQEESTPSATADGKEIKIDEEGNLYVLDENGNFTYLDMDGTVAQQNADGSSSLKEADGSEMIFNTNGTVTEKYKTGNETVVVETKTNANGDVTSSEMFFEGGKGKIDTLSAYDEDYKLTGANGTTISHTTTEEIGIKKVTDTLETRNSDGGVSSVTTTTTTIQDFVNKSDATHTDGTFSFTDGEGGYVKGTVSEDANGNQTKTMETNDGTNIYQDDASGTLKYTDADGNYIDSTPEHLGYHNAENGDHGDVNLVTGEGEMTMTGDDGEKYVYSHKDGRTTIGTEGGEKLTVNADGSYEITGASDEADTGSDVSNDAQSYEDMVSQTDKYISTDSDGDLTVKDAVTGKETLYTHNDDGTYTSTVSGQNYTKDEIRNDLAHTANNAGYYSDIESKRTEAVTEQRAANQGLSEADKKFAQELHNTKEEQAREEKAREIGRKHGLHTDDVGEVYDKVMKDQTRDEKVGEYYRNRAENMDAGLKVAKTTETVADMSMDALENLTGPAGKTLNAAYKVGKGAIGKGTDAYVNDKNVVSATLQGAVEGGIDVGAGKLSGGYKAGATVAGETVKGGLDAYMNDKDIAQGMKKGFVKGTVNAAVDAGSDYLGGKMKEATTAAMTDSTKTAIEEAGNVIDAGTSIADNLTKNYINGEIDPDDD